MLKSKISYFIIKGSMSSITNFSSQISDKLRTRRQDVAQLSATHTTLQKLQFVLELPDKLKECLKEEQYRKAVQYWVKASAALEHYRSKFFKGQKDWKRIKTTGKSFKNCAMCTYSLFLTKIICFSSKFCKCLLLCVSTFFS